MLSSSQQSRGLNYVTEGRIERLPVVKYNPSVLRRGWTRPKDFKKSNFSLNQTLDSNYLPIFHHFLSRITFGECLMAKNCFIRSLFFPSRNFFAKATALYKRSTPIERENVSHREECCNTYKNYMLTNTKTKYRFVLVFLMHEDLSKLF